MVPRLPASHLCRGPQLITVGAAVFALCQTAYWVGLAIMWAGRCLG